MHKKLTQLFQNNKRISAVCDGTILRLEDIPEPAIANRMIGDGIALQHSEKEIYGCCEGVVTLIAPSKHAMVITSEHGAQILIHFGIHTNKENEQHFHHHVKVNDLVSLNTLLTSISSEYMQQNNEKLITFIVILNKEEHPIKAYTTAHFARKGKLLFTYK